MRLLKITAEDIKKKIAKSEKTELRRMASSINTLWGHARTNGYPIAIVTAFRGARKIKGKWKPRYSYAENLRRNEALKVELSKLPVSYVHIKGHFIEGWGTKDAHSVEEQSFFVIGNLMHEEDFKREMMRLGAKFNQDAIAFKPADDKVIYGVGTQDHNEEGKAVEPGYGNQVPYGEFHPSQIGDIYSKLKGRPFTFASLVDNLDSKSTLLRNKFIRGSGEMLDKEGNVVYTF